jgi:hypothetical protein
MRSARKCLATPSPADRGVPWHIVYVNDVDQTLTRIAEHGGTAAALPRAEGTLRVATFRDPEGNLIGVWTETAVRHGEPGSQRPSLREISGSARARAGRPRGRQPRPRPARTKADPATCVSNSARTRSATRARTRGARALATTTRRRRSQPAMLRPSTTRSPSRRGRASSGWRSCGASYRPWRR